MIVEAGCIGREQELAAVLAQLDAPRPPLVLVGPPGVGKSTMLRAVAAALRAQGRLVVAGVPDGTVDGRPVVVVDDADRLAPEALAALQTAPGADPDVGPRVLLAATALTPAIEALVPDVLPLGGLSARAVNRLAADRGRPAHPEVVDRLVRHTGGNPREVLELLDQLPPADWTRSTLTLPAPDRVLQQVRATLESCPLPARRLIEALAVLDEGESFGTATQLADLTDPLAALDAAQATGLVGDAATLVPAQARPKLVDPMVRAAVLEVMGVAAVGAQHLRAAELATDPVQRLRHRTAATPVHDRPLADELAAAARRLSSEGAWADAADLFAQAARLTAEPLDHDRRLTQALDARLADGDCRSAGALVPGVESLRETARRDVALAYLAILRGRSTEARVRLDRAWNIVNNRRESEVGATIAQRFVLHHLIRGQGPSVVEWADRAIELGGADSPAGVEAASIRGLGLAWSGRSAEAVAAYDELAQRVRSGAQVQRVQMGRGWLELGRGELESARSQLQTAVSMAGLGGSKRITLWALGWLGRVHFLGGDWEQALTVVEEGRRLAADSGIDLVTGLLVWTAAQISSLRGDWATAQRAIDSLPTGDYELMRVPALLARAQIAEAQADYRKVIRILDPLPELAASSPALVEPGLFSWVDVLANAQVLAGRYDDADALLGTYEPIARERENLPARARLGYARGRLLGATGDIHGARRVFDEAVEIVADLPLRFDAARVHFAYGQTLRRAGKRRAADTVMATAREIYASLGAVTYVERCDRELKAGGVHAARGDRDHAELTPQEEAVAALVSRGLSNREVADELYISPKTVQYHLTRIYAKLGLRSRAELAAARN